MLRLTGGQFRGRLIQTPRESARGQDKTRPTQAKLRQALFNSIQAHLPEARVLDLFAGSGALGFEALSRGAARVVFLESSRVAIKLIGDNARTLGVESQVKTVGEALNPKSPSIAWAEGEAPFDLVLADPPYSDGWELSLLALLPWERLLAPGGLFCLEWGVQKSRFEELPARVPHLAKVREKHYGDSALSTYERMES